jgi:hypothetical protein
LQKYFVDHFSSVVLLIRALSQPIGGIFFGERLFSFQPIFTLMAWRLSRMARR